MEIEVPCGVWVSALSTRIRRICATRSGSARAVGGPVAVDLDRGAVALGRRAELLRDPPGELTQVDAVGVELEHVGVQLREVEEVGGELREALDLLAHRSHELVARRRVRLLVLEQLDEAAEREDRGAQLVRGVGDELLAGLSSRARRFCISLKVRASWPTSSVESIRDRGREVALGDLLGGRLQPAQPPRVRPSGEPARRQRRRQGDRAGDQDLAPDQRHVVVHVVERRREHRDPARPPADEQRDRGLAQALAVDRSTSEATRPLAAAAAAPRVVGADRGALELGVADDELGPRPAPAPSARRAGSRARRSAGRRRGPAGAARPADARAAIASRAGRSRSTPPCSSRSSFSAVRLERSCGTTYR